MKKSDPEADRALIDAVPKVLGAVGKRARDHFLVFNQLSMPTFQVNWHHRLMATGMERFIRREIKNVMFLLPPRVGKTQQVSIHGPAWALGHNPDLNIIAGAYSDNYASRINRAIQRTIDSPFYRVAFPDVWLPGPDAPPEEGRTVRVRTNREFEIVGRRGRYLSSGVGGAFTGSGGQLLFLDDPIKNSQQADSALFRDGMWEWYVSTFATRGEGDVGKCVIQTRWHEDDLAGRLLAQAKADPEADQWTVFDFPMILESPRPGDPRQVGEALWPERISLERCARIRATDARVWNSLYQQRPSSSEGENIKREWLKRWVDLPNRFDDVIISVDCAFKETSTSDFVAIQVWARIGACFLLIDQVRARMDFPKTINAILATKARFPESSAIVVEDKANGPAIISVLQKRVPGVVPYNPQSSKTARLSAVAPWFMSGNVQIPDERSCPWVSDYVEELVTFPNGANDDQVDATSQALLYFKDNDSTLQDLIKW